MSIEDSYYSILELARNADEDDIRKAYRKMAFRWHPDKNPDNMDGAEAMFKKISEAYEVLSNLEKRSLYDSFGKAGLGAHSAHSMPYATFSSPIRFQCSVPSKGFHELFNASNIHPRFSATHGYFRIVLPTHNHNTPMQARCNMQAQSLPTPVCSHSHPAQHPLLGFHLPVRHLPEHHLPGQHLPGHHMTGQHLPGHHLPGQHLPAHHLPGQHLQGCHLPGHNLVRRHLPGQHDPKHHVLGHHLLGHQLLGHSAPGHYLQGQHLQGQHLQGQFLVGQHLQGQHLVGHHLAAQQLSGHQLSGHDLSIHQLSGHPSPQAHRQHFQVHLSGHVSTVSQSYVNSYRHPFNETCISTKVIEHGIQPKLIEDNRFGPRITNWPS